jgi:hypothetical protein
LERELAYLGGMCAGSLIKKDISLPPGIHEPISSANNEKVNIIKNCWKTNSILKKVLTVMYR